MLSIDGGVVNEILMTLGIVTEPVNFVGASSWFYPLIIVTDLWKNVGWNAIIYLAALSGIDPGLYEAAKVDGANRFRQIWHISLPGLRPTIAMMLIFAISGLMNADFDQLYTMGNAAVEKLEKYWIHWFLEYSKLEPCLIIPMVLQWDYLRM